MYAKRDTRGTKRLRTGKRIAVTMVAAVAAVALVSGVGNLPQSVEALTHRTVVECNYEAANSGDLVATVVNDQSGLSLDGYIDQGGCIFTSTNDDLNSPCVLPVTREGGLGVGLGTLTLDGIADGLMLDSGDALATNASTQCDLRPLPDHTGNVKVEVSIWDDVYAGQTTGFLCADENDDNICGTDEPGDWICNVDDPAATREVTFSSFGSIAHLVLFINGPENSGDHGLGDPCDSDDQNPIGGTMAGYLDPAGQVIFEFTEV